MAAAHTLPGGPVPLLATCFAVCMSLAVLVATLQPWLFSWYNMDPSVSLGLAMLLIGHAIDLRDLAPPKCWLTIPAPAPGQPSRGSPARGRGTLLSTSATDAQRVGWDVWVAGLLSSLLVWPLLGVLLVCGAAWWGAGPDLLVGLALTMACPPGSASNLAPSRLCGLPVAPVAVLCTAFTLLAGHTFAASLRATQAALHLVAPQALEPGWWGVLAHARVQPLAHAAFAKHGLASLLMPFVLSVTSRTTLTAVLGQVWPASMARVVHVLPLLAPVGILVTAANKLALNARLTRQFPALVAGVLLLHAAAYGLGWLLPWMAGASPTACHISSIQAGARNPAVGFVLTSALLASPEHSHALLALAPCAVSIWAQNVVGSALAAWWATRRDVEQAGGRGTGMSLRNGKRLA